MKHIKANNDAKLLETHRSFYTGERRDQNLSRLTTPGSQHLVQLLKGGHLDGNLGEGTGKQALDVGCGSGFNCVTLARLGYAVCGCEIDQTIVNHARQTLLDYNCQGEITIGCSEKLPYENDRFDLLTSMNVIHYLPTLELVEHAFAEYARVLRPGGRIYLTTNHPDNWILQDAEHLGNNTWRTSRQRDYRDGLSLYVFENQKMLAEACSPWFEKLMTGENRYDFFTKVVRNLTLTGLCRRNACEDR